MSLTSWRKILNNNFKLSDEDIQKIEFNPKDLDLDVVFDSGYGSAMGRPFYGYTEKYVYYCNEYDGAETIHRVPRNLDDSKPKHDGEYFV